MENLNGLFALLAACIEFVLFINLLVFSEKNRVNKLIIIFVLILMLDQFIEFIICYTGMNGLHFVISKFILIIIIPVILIQIILEISYRTKRKYLWLYLPAIMLIVFYLTQVESFTLTYCSVLLAGFTIPSELVFNIYYLAVLAIGCFILYRGIKSQGNHKKLFIIIFAELVFGYLPAVVFSLVSEELNEVRVSLAGKMIIPLTVTLVYFALKNKSSE